MKNLAFLFVIMLMIINFSINNIVNPRYFVTLQKIKECRRIQ
jgi:hypothetical protein